MKTKLRLFGVIASLLAVLVLGYGCSTDTQAPVDTNSSNSKNGSVAVASLYNVVLESVVDNGDGTWTWTWSIENPNPGNGSGGTVKDLSHWNMDLGTCASIDNVVSAAYSGDGTNWTSFTPGWAIDASMCNTCNLNCSTPVFKFDFGTVDDVKSWYQITVDEEFEPAQVAGYSKGGTTCHSFTFEGIGCPPEEDPGPQCTAEECESQGPFPYSVSDPTITNNGDGTWTWEWAITNNNPGNGKPGTGTYQALSHFNMPWNTCLNNCGDESMIVSASHKVAGALDWTTFTPTFAVDPSMCNTCAMNCDLNVLKFNVGTNGASSTLLRVVVNQDLAPQTQVGYYKSGKNTGCGCINFKGLGCAN